MIRHAEIIIDAIQVNDLGFFAFRCSQDSQIQRDLGFSGTVVPDENDHLFHKKILSGPLPAELQLLHHTHEELRSTGNAFQAYMLVVAMYAAPLLSCHFQRGKAVNPVGNAAVVSAVRTLDHQIG